MRRRAVVLVLVAAFVATVSPARGQTVGSSIIGAASAEIDEPGSLTPVGNGRFATRDRTYEGSSLGRSVDDELASCFTGQFMSSEEWLLETPKLTGSHQSTVRIRPERGTVTLRLSGDMDALTASGSWEVIRATGPCDGLEAEGRYTATYSDRAPNVRLTFAGSARK